jgi:hypothetical protein
LAKRDQLEPGTRCIIKKESLCDLNGKSLYQRIVIVQQVIDTGHPGSEVAQVTYEDKQPGMSYIYCKHIKPKPLKQSMYTVPSS